MSFLGRKKDKDDNQQSAGAPPSPGAPPTIDPNTGLPPPYEPPDPNAPKDDGEKVGFVQGIRNYIMDSYNGLYKIVLEPSMPKRATIAVLLVGVLLGMIFAYAIFPTEFTGAGPRRMSDDATEQWVRMVAVGYSEGIAYNEDTALAVLNQLPNPQQTAARLANDESVPSFERQAVAELQAIQGFNELTGSVAPQDPGLIGSLMQWIIPLILVMIITPILVLVWRLLIYPNIVAGIIDQVKQATNAEYREQKQREQRDRDILKEQNRLKEEMKKNAVADADFGEPVMQTISIYTKGRNYDDSFAIELGPEQGNQFLGECGAGIATKAGSELESVEFWAFDMATQDTLTKIFAAPGAINDPTFQAKVSNRVKNPATDIVVAEPGAKLLLGTDENGVRVQGEIATISYTDGNGIPNGAIENMQMKVITWQTQGSPVGAPAGGPPPIPPAQPLPDYSDMQFDAPPQMPSQPASPPPAGGRSMDEYAGMQFDPPPQMPSQPASPPPAGGRSLDEYDDIQFDPPPQMPGQNPLQPPPLQMPPSGGINPLQPPPLQMPSDDDDDDPFGGTGDFTPLR